MILCHLSIRNVLAIIQIVLLQSALCLALPTVNHISTSRAETENIVQTIQWDTPSKRALGSNVIPKIAGGAVGIVAFGLICGLGSASIAVFGSVEWQAFRGKGKEEKQDKAIEGKGKQESSDSDSESGSINNYNL
ncbi:hypothetical protein VM1G_06559 [Cytospora mali]|uniref:Uncharacterized protein n=1 Tax=Cytospora mali TaxID=578113 RepID=A0A194W1D2_CYTMA|nr:hypothetical protein VM1G_06559 [Valsa mali]